MSRRLNDLSPTFKPYAVELLARFTEAGIPVCIVDTLRTPEEHAKNLANGTSWTKHSLHLTGDAIDICPYDMYQLHGRQKLQWNSKDPVWERLARIGEAMGLECGYRWQQKDCGHFQLPRPAQKEVLA